jgi:hypothetical protein
MAYRYRALASYLRFFGVFLGIVSDEGLVRFVMSMEYDAGTAYYVLFDCLIQRFILVAKPCKQGKENPLGFGTVEQ